MSHSPQANAPRSQQNNAAPSPLASSPSPSNTTTKSSQATRSPHSKYAHSMQSAFERHIVHSEHQLDRELQSAINDIKRSDALYYKHTEQEAVRAMRHENGERRREMVLARHEAVLAERRLAMEAKLAGKEERALSHQHHTSPDRNHRDGNTNTSTSLHHQDQSARSPAASSGAYVPTFLTRSPMLPPIAGRSPTKGRIMMGGMSPSSSSPSSPLALKVSKEATPQPQPQSSLLGPLANVVGNPSATGSRGDEAAAAGGRRGSNTFQRDTKEEEERKKGNSDDEDSNSDGFEDASENEDNHDDAPPMEDEAKEGNHHNHRDDEDDDDDAHLSQQRQPLSLIAASDVPPLHDPFVLNAIQSRLPRGRRLHCIVERQEGRRVEALTRQHMARQAKQKKQSTSQGPPLSDLVSGRAVPVKYGRGGGERSSSQMNSDVGVSVTRRRITHSTTAAHDPHHQEGIRQQQQSLTARPASRSAVDAAERMVAMRALLSDGYGVSPATTAMTTTARGGDDHVNTSTSSSAQHNQSLVATSSAASLKQKPNTAEREKRPSSVDLALAAAARISADRNQRSAEEKRNHQILLEESRCSLSHAASSSTLSRRGSSGPKRQNNNAGTNNDNDEDDVKSERFESSSDEEDKAETSEAEEDGQRRTSATAPQFVKRVSKEETGLRFFDDEERFSRGEGEEGDEFSSSSSSSEDGEETANRRQEATPSDPIVEPTRRQRQQQGQGSDDDGEEGAMYHPYSPNEDLMRVVKKKGRTAPNAKGVSPQKKTVAVVVPTGVLPRRGLPMYGQPLVPPARGKRSTSNPKSGSTTDGHPASGTTPPPRRLPPITANSAAPMADTFPNDAAKRSQSKTAQTTKTSSPPHRRHADDTSAATRLLVAHSLLSHRGGPVRTLNKALRSPAVIEAEERERRLRGRGDGGGGGSDAIVDGSDNDSPSRANKELTDIIAKRQKGFHFGEAKRGALLWLQAHRGVVASETTVADWAPSPKQRTSSIPSSTSTSPTKAKDEEAANTQDEQQRRRAAAAIFLQRWWRFIKDRWRFQTTRLSWHQHLVLTVRTEAHGVIVRFFRMLIARRDAMAVVEERFGARQLLLKQAEEAAAAQAAAITPTDAEAIIEEEAVAISSAAAADTTTDAEASSCPPHSKVPNEEGEEALPPRHSTRHADDAALRDLDGRLAALEAEAEPADGEEEYADDDYVEEEEHQAVAEMAQQDSNTPQPEGDDGGGYDDEFEEDGGKEGNGATDDAYGDEDFEGEGEDKSPRRVGGGEGDASAAAVLDASTIGDGDNATNNSNNDDARAASSSSTPLPPLEVSEVLAAETNVANAEEQESADGERGQRGMAAETIDAVVRGALAHVSLSPEEEEDDLRRPPTSDSQSSRPERVVRSAIGKAVAQQ